MKVFGDLAISNTRKTKGAVRYMACKHLGRTWGGSPELSRWHMLAKKQQACTRKPGPCGPAHWNHNVHAVDDIDGIFHRNHSQKAGPKRFCAHTNRPAHPRAHNCFCSNCLRVHRRKEVNKQRKNTPHELVCRAGVPTDKNGRLPKIIVQ